MGAVDVSAKDPPAQGTDAQNQQLRHEVMGVEID